MAYVVPDSIVYILSGVECDKTFDNVKWFNSKSEQFNYMLDHRIKTYDNISYIRDGVIMIDAWADDIYSANYLMFQNSAFTDRWFYAFIDEIRWENNRTAEVHYHIDLWQTWWMDCKVGECFVEREHVLDDTVGLHTIPEGIEYGQLEVSSTKKLTDFCNNIVYGIEIVISDEQLSGIDSQPQWFSGSVLGKVFQGSKIGVTEDPERLIDFCQNIVTAGYTNTIQQIFTIPKVLAPNSASQSYNGQRKLDNVPVRFGDYRPHNNKLYTSPYCEILVYCPDGNQMILHPERFKDRSSRWVQFTGNRTSMPQIVVTPRNYNGDDTDDTDFTRGFTINYGQKGSFMYDAWQASVASYGVSDRINKAIENAPDWLVNERSSELLNNLGNAINTLFKYQGTATSTVSGAIKGGETGGIAGAIGGAASGIAGSLGQISKDTHDTSTLSGSSGGSVLWSRSLQEVFCQVRQIREEYARIVDQYFDMYGYRINRVKRPQMEGRPAWNYIKCKNVALTGKIPADAQELIKSVIEHGVTFWKTDFHNYSADNSI